jgi:DNA-binding transcriptional LysR family regulator
VDLKQLRYFQAVTHLGRIGAAARQLGITQPALTAALHKLEADMGATLFVRDHRGAHLTASGRELAAVVDQMLRAIDDARQRIVDIERAPAGRVIVGCPPVLGAYVLPPFVAHLVATHPGIDLVIATAPSRAIEDQAVARDVDIGLVTHPVAHPDLVLVDLFRDQVELVVRADEPETATWSDAAARLARGPLIYAPHVPQSRELLDLLDARGLVPKRHVECRDVGLVKEMALAGVGVAILPRRVAAHRADGALRPLHDGLPVIPDRIHLVYRVDLHRRRAANLVKNALVDHARTLV